MTPLIGLGVPHEPPLFARYFKRVGGDCASNFSTFEELGIGSQFCLLGLNDSTACELGSLCTSSGGGQPPPPPPPHWWAARPDAESLDLNVLIEARWGEDRPRTYVQDSDQGAQSFYARLDPPGQCESDAPLDSDCQYVENLVDKFGQRLLTSRLTDDLNGYPDTGNPYGWRPHYNSPTRYRNPGAGSAGFNSIGTYPTQVSRRISRGARPACMCS
jgi:hypothetical protein